MDGRNLPGGPLWCGTDFLRIESGGKNLTFHDKNLIFVVKNKFCTI